MSALRSPLRGLFALPLALTAACATLTFSKAPGEVSCMEACRRDGAGAQGTSDCEEGCRAEAAGEVPRKKIDLAVGKAPPVVPAPAENEPIAEPEPPSNSGMLGIFW